MKTQNNIKKAAKSLLLIFLLFVLIPGFVFGASATPATKKAKVRVLPKAVVKKSTIQKTQTPDILRPRFKRAEILNFTIGTERNGIWFWEATIKNTGTVELDAQRTIVQAYKVSFPKAQNNWTGASGSIIGPGNLLPNQTRVIKEYWTRCCKTDLLKVDLRDNTTNTVLDTETLSHLVQNPVQNRPLNVKVKKIEWNSVTKTWQATLKNISSYTVKLSVQGYLWPANTTTPVPAGGNVVTLGPNGETSTMWLHATTAQNGDMLKVHTKFLMGNNVCNESNNDCGFKGSNNITIPNSHTFLN